MVERELRGIVEDGVVRVTDGGTLAEGVRVSIRPLSQEASSADRVKKKSPVSAALRRLAGAIRNLPPDAASSIDRALYGRTDGRGRSRSSN